MVARIVVHLIGHQFCSSVTKQTIKISGNRKGTFGIEKSEATGLSRRTIDRTKILGFRLANE